MKKSLITLTIVLAVAAMVGLMSTPAMAAVTGSCNGCHTMHNSQGGADLYATPYDTLLKGDCVVCHSSSTDPQTYTSAGNIIPVVNYTGVSEPATWLAGGNFWWVATDGGNSDAKGHNVYGIAAQDSAITVDEGAPGDGNSCGPGSCHATLALENSTGGYAAPGGCQGCHLQTKHHVNDGSGTKYVGTENKWYRFLAGHQSGAPPGTYGVEGIEDSDWQKSVGENDHNEYKGKSGEGAGTLVNGDGTMTAFCSGCHGNFHSDQGSSGAWTRHPSDLVITNSGEYASVTTFGYDPTTPVARTDAAMTILDGSPSGTVAAGADMVMCLSCHRPHGSAYDDLLRWQYSGMVAGTTTVGVQNKGCFYCHSQKDSG